MPHVGPAGKHPALGGWGTDLVVALVLVAVTRLAASAAEGRSRLLLLHVILLAVPLTATWLVFRRARTVEGRLSAHLRWLAIGLASWTAGEAYWFFSEIVLQRMNPFPSWADIGFLGLFPALVVALIRAPSGSAHEASRLRRSVDALGIGSALLLLLWARPLLGTLDELEHAGVVAASVGLAYPSVDVLLLSLLTVLLVGATASWRPALLRYALGVGMLLLADAGFVTSAAAGTYATGSWLDSGWTVGFALIARGASCLPSGVDEPSRSVAARSRVTEALVLGGFLGAGVLAAAETFDGHLEEHPVLSVFMSLVFAAVVFRQSCARAEGEAYARQLAQTQESMAHLEQERRIALDAAGMAPLSWSAARQSWTVGDDTRALLGLAHGGAQASDAEVMRAVDKQGRAALRGLRGSVSPTRPEYDLELALRSDPARHVRIRGLSEWSEQGDVQNLIGVVFDVTESWRARQAEAQRELHSVTLSELGARLADAERLDEAVSDAVTTIGRVLEVAGVEAWSQGEQLASWRSPATGAAWSVLPDGAATATLEFEVWAETRSWGWLRVRAGTLTSEETALVVAVVALLGADIGRRDAQEALWHGARYDELTGIPNRVLLGEHLASVLGPGSQGAVAVACLDLDDFKQVNDRFGHPVGDLLLALVAMRLQACLRPGDLVARLGGDEFAIVMHGLESVQDAMEVADRAREGLNVETDLGPTSVTARAGIGIATTGESGYSATELLRNAELAMHVAKRQGSLRPVQFEPRFHDAAAAEGLVADELRDALSRGELVVHYQPVVDLASGALCGAEALLRWKRPGRDLCPPDTFLPVLERLGLMPEVSAFVLAEACAWASAYLDLHGAGPFSIAVNLRPADVTSPAFAGLVTAALAAAHLEPARLTLELVESGVLADVPAAAEGFKLLRAQGVRIAIDDFGTGYSSMSQLKSLPVDIVKIDKSFVKGLATEMDDSALVSAIISMAHSLGLDVVAEGIETDRQWRALIALGCEMGQGYYFGRPVEAEPESFAVQAAPPGQMRAPTRRLVVADPASRPLTVVIADDLEDDRKILGRYLARSSEFVLLGEATDGAQAVALVRDLKPDLALLDVDMPGLDGFGALTQIRAGTPQTQVVMLSGHLSAVTVHAAREAGALGCLAKGPSDVIGLLRTMLNGRGAEQLVSHPARD